MLQQQQEAGQPRGPAVLTSGTLRLDVGPMAAAARAPLAANNQKLGLLATLLRVREAAAGLFPQRTSGKAGGADRGRAFWPRSRECAVRLDACPHRDRLTQQAALS
jgi:hypothetical protein